MTLQSQSIRELDFERSAANPSDWMILQDFENGQTYRIRRSDFLAGTQTSFLWSAATTYAANAIVEWGGTFWRSLQAGNVNRVPGEGAWWTEVEQADESAVKLFEANKIYKSDIVVVLHNNQLYRLTNATRPYQAATFITADWQVITPSPQFAFSSSAPENISVRWVDTSVTINQANPIRDFINGAWTPVSLNCDWWDTVGKVVSKGRPLAVAFSGQSNCFSSFYTPQNDPGYLGDVSIDPFVTIFNYTTLQWNVYDFANQTATYGDAVPQNIGTNSIQIFAKLFARKYNRSVRLVGRRQGGTPLAAWEANRPQWNNLISTINSANITDLDALIFIHGEGGLSDINNPTGFSTYQQSLYDFISRFRSQSWASNKTKFIMPSNALAFAQTLIQAADLTDSNGAEKAARSLSGGENLNNAWAAIHSTKDLQSTGTQDPLHWTTRELEWIGQSIFFEYEKLNSFRKKESPTTTSITRDSAGNIVTEKHFFQNSDVTEILWTSRTNNAGRFSQSWSNGSAINKSIEMRIDPAGSFSESIWQILALNDLQLQVDKTGVKVPRGAVSSGNANGAGAIGNTGFLVRSVGGGGSLDAGIFLSEDGDGLGLKSAWSGSNNPNFKFWFGNLNTVLFEYLLNYASYRYQFDDGPLAVKSTAGKKRYEIDSTGLAGSANLGVSGSLTNSIVAAIDAKAPPNSVIVFEITVMGVRQDSPNQGALAFSGKKSGTYRKNNASTWFLVGQSALTVQEDSVGSLASVTFGLTSNVPNVTITRGSTAGTYAVNFLVTYQILNL